MACNILHRALGRIAVLLLAVCAAWGADGPGDTPEPILLTPPPGPAPRINPPRTVGVRPGAPFLFRIPATGERPMTFSVKPLPDGLALDSAAGIISGRVVSTERKTYTMALRAENAHGADSRDLRVVVGDTLALTPPMGWNHWYAHYDRVTGAMMREAADIMVSSGMADVGYQYVNIDDCWMNAPKNNDPLRVGPLRDDVGNILPNAHFPDMRALTDYIHAKGLKAGIYTSPGPLTCAGFSGSYEHEPQDAAQFAAWGFDFLKYDWCSYGNIAKDKSLPELKKPYEVMGAILKQQPRDIVLNLCQYGMGDVWTWGESVGGHCWRTAGDLGFELTDFYRVAKANAEHARYARPGAWNDPDYIQIGFVGDARKMGAPTPCPMTPNEQYAYMSLWCLMAAPLVYSGDMTRLDPFTLNVLCNPEVIEIDQDPLGKQGVPVANGKGWEIWKKDLEQGRCAVGVFNRTDREKPVTVRWRDIAVRGPQQVRDLWRQQDIAANDTAVEVRVPARGVALLQLTPQ